MPGHFAEIDGKKKWVGKLFLISSTRALGIWFRSGTTEGVVMKIGGHLTRAVFDGYKISSMKDIEEAAERRRS